MTPASALAGELIAQGFDVQIMTDVRGIKYKDMFPNMAMLPIESGTAGVGFKGKILGAFKLAKGLIQALVYIQKSAPQCVVGFGGYPSVPAVWAAQMLSVPTIIHEQNAVIGKANAFLSAKAKAIAISLQKVQGLSPEEQKRVHITGNPVRADIESLRDKPYPVFNDESDLNVVVVGGSLGATVLSEVVPKAFKSLPPSYKQRLSVVQQCRDADLPVAKKLYEGSNINVRLTSFIDDMATEIEKAHLIIGRSGASTVAELGVAGRPAIFVPYPHHKDQQQKMNAETISDNGGAWVIVEGAFSSETVKTRIERIFQTPSILADIAEKAKSCGEPNAASRLAKLVNNIIQNKD